ncbi:MAG TPA: hypothetical protein VF144_14310 [Chitinophagaceae bacterium]
MRKTCLVILLFVTVCCAAQKTFQKNFGGDKFDRALFIDHTSDGGYIICGYSNSFNINNSYDMYVVKLDEAATIQWQKTFGGSRTDIGWGIQELKDKTYLLFGGMGVDSTNDDIFITRLDASGNKLWERSYGGPAYERCTQMIQTSDNNFVFIGQRNSKDGNIDSYILKIDGNGNLIWEKTFGGPAIERTFYGAEIPGGDLLISGLTLPHGNNKADIYFIRLNKNGESVWNKTYGEKDVHEIVHSFCMNSDKKTYTLTGYSETTKEGFHEGLFLQIDENGNVVKKQTHNNNEDLRLMHAELTNDGGFVVTGYTRKDIVNEISDAVLLEFDKDGKVKWLKTFGDADKDDQGYWIVINKDGSYTFVGYTHSAGKNGDILLIKTNAVGELN